MQPRVIVFAASALCGAAAVHAQSHQRVSIQASGLLATLNGSSFDQIGFGSGFGGEFQVRINPSAFSVGAGVQLTRHSGTVTGFTDKMTLTGLFLEPRYAFHIQSRTMRPYAAGRIALLKQSLSRGTGSSKVDVTANATAFGAGGGVIIRISSTISADIGAALTSASFGDYKSGGQSINEAAGSGSSFVLKAGFSLGLGK